MNPRLTDNAKPSLEPPPITGAEWRTLGRGVAFLAALIVLGIALLFATDFDDTVFAKRLGTVEPGSIYRSGQISSLRIGGVLDHLDIDRIVRLTRHNPDDAWQQRELQIAEQHAINVHAFDLAGNGTGDPAHYIEALTLIYTSRAAGEIVLVHCAAGSERTGVATFFWRTLFEQMPVDDAVDELLSYNHRPHRNPALKAYLRRYAPRITAELQARGLPVRPIPESQIRRLPDHCSDCVADNGECYDCDSWPVEPQISARR